jgi:hypothetical protein
MQVIQLGFLSLQGDFGNVGGRGRREPGDLAVLPEQRVNRDRNQKNRHTGENQQNGTTGERGSTFVICGACHAVIMPQNRVLPRRHFSEIAARHGNQRGIYQKIFAVFNFGLAKARDLCFFSPPAVFLYYSSHVTRQHHSF